MDWTFAVAFSVCFLCLCVFRGALERPGVGDDSTHFAFSSFSPVKKTLSGFSCVPPAPRPPASSAVFQNLPSVSTSSSASYEHLPLSLTSLLPSYDTVHGSRFSNFLITNKSMFISFIPVEPLIWFLKAINKPADKCGFEVYQQMSVLCSRRVFQQFNDRWFKWRTLLIEV